MHASGTACPQHLLTGNIPLVALDMTLFIMGAMVLLFGIVVAAGGKRPSERLSGFVNMLSGVALIILGGLLIAL